MQIVSNFSDIGDVFYVVRNADKVSSRIDMNENIFFLSSIIVNFNDIHTVYKDKKTINQP